jgi:hypothetical protein
MKKTARKAEEAEIRELHIGDFKVDTGTMILGDPCYLQQAMADYAAADGDDLIDAPDCPRDERGMGKFVKLETGLGDGIYPVIAAQQLIDCGTKHWVTLAIMISFANPFRNSGCQKPFPHPSEEGCKYGATK